MKGAVRISRGEDDILPTLYSDEMVGGGMLREVSTSIKLGGEPKKTGEEIAAASAFCVCDEGRWDGPLSLLPLKKERPLAPLKS